jgi:hypothetical protein
MGHNRGGDNRRVRLRRARRETERLAGKERTTLAATGSAAEPPPGRPAMKPTLGGGVLTAAKEVARVAVEKVGEAIESAGQKIKEAAE